MGCGGRREGAVSTVHVPCTFWFLCHAASSPLELMAVETGKRDTNPLESILVPQKPCFLQGSLFRIALHLRVVLVSQGLVDRRRRQAGMESSGLLGQVFLAMYHVFVCSLCFLTRGRAGHLLQSFSPIFC